MNEEEKEAIHKLKSVINNDTGVISDDIQDDEIETILGLINKQQKEIEELSIIKNSIQTLETHFVNDDTYYVIAKENFLEGDFRHLLDDYISKDKIKKLKELVHKTLDDNGITRGYQLTIDNYFKELLEE